MAAPTCDLLSEAEAIVHATRRKRCDLCGHHPPKNICGLCRLAVCRDCYPTETHAKVDAEAMRREP